MPRYHVYVWTDKTFTVEAEDEPEWYEDLLKTMGWTNE